MEIWFGVEPERPVGAGSPGSTLYVLAGGRRRADFVRNLEADAAVKVVVGGTEYPATARVLAPGTEEDARARRLLLDKYQAPGSDDLEGWGRRALAVAFDLGG